jgi:hypothetical protein
MSSAAAFSESDRKHDALSAQILQKFFEPEEGWVMVNPGESIAAEPPIDSGIGAVGCNGQWKFHVSINPEQLPLAVPLIVEALLCEGAPRLGFKIQKKTNLDSEHQIGKELAIIFDEQAELDAQQGGTAIQRCLRLLWTKLHSAGICAESGLVLTAQTMDVIRASPAASHVYEKRNLEAGKFDRAIACPSGGPAVYYRHENCLLVHDDLWKDIAGEQGVVRISDVLNLARARPEFAHNPTMAPDPFLHIQI